MIVPYGHVFLLAGILFLSGLLCTLIRRSLLMVLVGVEVMLNSASIAFVGASLRWQRLDGQVFVLFILAVAAAEVSVGLALFVAAYRKTGSVHMDRYETLKG
jgi:NADH-quinone oxidoreductase subunit K